MVSENVCHMVSRTLLNGPTWLWLLLASSYTFWCFVLHTYVAWFRIYYYIRELISSMLGSELGLDFSKYTNMRLHLMADWHNSIVMGHTCPESPSGRPGDAKRFPTCYVQGGIAKILGGWPPVFFSFWQRKKHAFSADISC